MVPISSGFVHTSGANSIEIRTLPASSVPRHSGPFPAIRVRSRSLTIQGAKGAVCRGPALRAGVRGASDQRGDPARGDRQFPTWDVARATVRCWSLARAASIRRVLVPAAEALPWREAPLLDPHREAFRAMPGLQRRIRALPILCPRWDKKSGGDVLGHLRSGAEAPDGHLRKDRVRAPWLLCLNPVRLEQRHGGPVDEGIPCG